MFHTLVTRLRADVNVEGEGGGNKNLLVVYGCIDAITLEAI